MRIYDCFTFFNELDLLEMRLNILNDKVDYFVLVESTKTHNGKYKELIFQQNAYRFSKFSKKIIHVIVDDMPELKDNNRWILENFQRNAIARGLSKCDVGDIILISDLDEIPNLDNIDIIKKILIMNTGKRELLYNLYYSIRKYIVEIKKNGKIMRMIKKILYRFPVKSLDMVGFRQKFYFYYLNGLVNNSWFGTKAVLYKDLIDHFNSSPQQIRESSAKNIIENGGWHFSYLLSPENIAKKIQAFAHSEFDTKEYTDISAIKKRIDEGEDLFGRKEKITYVKMDDSYPKWILDTIGRYGRYIKENHSDGGQNSRQKI